MKRKELRKRIGLSVMAGSLTFVLITGNIKPTFGMEEGGLVAQEEAEEEYCDQCGISLVNGNHTEESTTEKQSNTDDQSTNKDVAGTGIGTSSNQVTDETKTNEEPVVIPNEDADTSTSEENPVAEDQTEEVVADPEVVPEETPVEVVTEVPSEIPSEPTAEVPTDVPADALAPRTPQFKPSNPFINMEDREKFHVDAQIEGLPAFIDLEMIVGALKTQDEFGYPASVTIAQIIQESGFGRFGPTASDGAGLSYLAYKFNNLFGIKGEGTLGTVLMPTSEMNASGELYRIQAGFRVYNTYSESILDRAELIERRYSDLIEDVDDANTFAIQIARRWATDRFYGARLIRVMERYDLYRLDEMTLGEYSEAIGFFANPVPGSVVTSSFGWRLHPVLGENMFHAGIDLGTNGANLPIYAAQDGVVTWVGYGPISGNWIEITHDNGMVTKYMHNAMNLVRLGQDVLKGQQIGIVGSTGRSTGPHLHFQVEMNKTPINPTQFLDLVLSESR